MFFSPKGNRIITTGADKAVRFWDTATNETVRTVRFPAGPGKEGSLVAAAMARNGKKLAVSGFPVGTVATGKVPIYMLSPETGDVIKTLNLGNAAVTALHFSNDGNRLAVGCDNGIIQLLDVTTGKEREIGKVQPSDASIMEVRYNPSPKLNVFATLGSDRWVQLWDMSKNTLIRDFPIRGVGPTTIAWSNDGQTLAVGTATGRIVLCTLAGKVIEPPLPAIMKDGRPVPITELQFLSGDSDIAVVGANSFAGIVDSNTGKVQVPFTGHSNTVSSIDVSADGRRVATSGGNQHETFVWEAVDGKVLNRFAGAGSGVWAIGWAKDGKSLAWGNSNVRPEKDAELPLQHTFRLDDFGVGNPPDPSKYTQTITEDGHVKVTTKSPLFLVQTTGREPEVMILTNGDKIDQIYSATCLPKGNAVAVAGGSSLALFNPATAREMRRFVGHTGNVLCVTPSPDGRYFATGSSDQTIRIWQRDLDEPLLSIFVAGRDWIAWTPQGFYACSGQGERLMAWQVPPAPARRCRRSTRPSGSARPCTGRPSSSTSSRPATCPRAGDGQEVRQGAHRDEQRGRRPPAGGHPRRVRRRRGEGREGHARGEGQRQERQAPDHRHAPAHQRAAVPGRGRGEEDRPPAGRGVRHLGGAAAARHAHRRGDRRLARE